MFSVVESQLVNNQMITVQAGRYAIVNEGVLSRTGQYDLTTNLSYAYIHEGT